jgi:hypothetical protein
LSVVSSPSLLDDVHVAVSNNCYTFPSTGMQVCTGNSLGATLLFDEGQHVCPAPYGTCPDAHAPKVHTYWYGVSVMDADEHSGSQYGNAVQRQATVAHELGHIFGLNEDSIYVSGCQSTLMDYDCLNAATSSNNYNRPWPKDSCGVNHAYYDPNWGWSGC